jgi:CRISPR/Cas system-associated endonuclease/helicase Cas3
MLTGQVKQSNLESLASLLRDHILIAADVVKAAKADNHDQLVSKEKKWKKNADDIAAFLSKANPNWPEKDLKDMLHEHLALTTDEVVGRLKKDWAADIAAYDKGHRHILKLADALADGIAKQFPDKLKG